MPRRRLAFEAKQRLTKGDDKQYIATDEMGARTGRMNRKRSPVTAQGPTRRSQNGQSVTALTEQNVESVSRLEEAAREQRTVTDRAAEAIAKFCGSITFVWVHVIWFGGWILLNVFPGLHHLDPFPFTFLTLIVSLEAIFLSTFILISQNLETRVSERRSHLDLQLNMLSEQENTKMIAILIAIAEKVGADLGPDPHLEALTEDTRPEQLVEQIEAHEGNTVRSEQ
jgi:uncharacterized membrane protein